MIEVAKVQYHVGYHDRLFFRTNQEGINSFKKFMHKMHERNDAVITTGQECIISMKISNFTKTISHYQCMPWARIGTDFIPQFFVDVLFNPKYKYLRSQIPTNAHANYETHYQDYLDFSDKCTYKMLNEDEVIVLPSIVQSQHKKVSGHCYLDKDGALYLKHIISDIIAVPDAEMYFKPAHIKHKTVDFKLWKESCEKHCDIYNDLLDKGMDEEAKDSLPENTAFHIFHDLAISEMSTLVTTMAYDCQNWQDNATLREFFCKTYREVASHWYEDRCNKNEDVRNVYDMIRKM